MRFGAVNKINTQTIFNVTRITKSAASASSCSAGDLMIDLAQHNAVFTDNYFYLDGEEKRVIPTSRNNLTTKILNEELCVHSVADTHSKHWERRRLAGMYEE
jgi:hypothetical protein